MVRQLRKFAQRPDHRVERIGDADDEGVGRVVPDPLADRLHHLQIDAEQIVAAHPRLAGDAGGDDDDVGALDVGIIVRALERDVEALDRAALGKIERLALRHALDHVEQDDVAKLLRRGEMGERAADIAGADKRDLVASHGALPAFLRSKAKGPQDAAERGDALSPLAREGQPCERGLFGSVGAGQYVAGEDARRRRCR